VGSVNKHATDRQTDRHGDISFPQRGKRLTLRWYTVKQVFFNVVVVFKRQERCLLAACMFAEQKRVIESSGLLQRLDKMYYTTMGEDRNMLQLNSGKFEQLKDFGTNSTQYMLCTYTYALAK
jgi:hypothetical protein